MAIYVTLFLLGLGFLLASALLGSLFDTGGGGDGGDGGDGGGEGGLGGADGPDLPSPFSPRTIAAAATGFGAGGGLALLNNVEPNPSIGFALVGGVLVGGTAYGFLAWLSRQQRTTHIYREQLVGLPATVITEISGSGLGEIMVLAGGQTSTYLARSATGNPVPRGTQVQIQALAGDTVLVHPLEPA